jgi:glycosyltransferase involved in cell wall biosynthesis
MRAVAIICARNEEVHLPYALPDLIREGLDVILIDHDSTDGTASIARQFLGHGLLGIERLPWKGYFSLTEQLEAKRRIIERLDHDWVVHVDADEWLSAPDQGQTLLAGLEVADSAGYNCVHFNEFVFVPRPGEDFTDTDYRRRLTRYYLHRPWYPFLLRAWRRDADLDNRHNAGHGLGPGARWFPQDFPMRHYISLSEAQAQTKYLTRKFDEDEIGRGWHLNRLQITKADLRFPDDYRMTTLPAWDSKEFDTSNSVKTHFWEWEQSPAQLAGPSKSTAGQRAPVRSSP